MKSIRLTKRTVDSAQADRLEFTLWDSDLTGFGLRVRPNGTKSYVVVYRAGTGRKAPVRKLTLGAARKLSPDQARCIARKAIGSIAHGNDPAKEKSTARKAMTLNELADVFLDEHVRPKRKAATLASYTASLRKYVRPHFGSMRADQLTNSVIGSMHVRLAVTPSAANRAVAVIRSMFNFGQRRGYVREGLNPANLIDKFPERSRERFLSPDELTRLGEALREAETSGIEWAVSGSGVHSKHARKPINRRTVFSRYGVAAVRLLLLTGCRLREVLGLKWEYVDLERGMIFLPDSKTGRKTIILNGPALLLINSLPRSGKHILPADGADRPRHDLKRVWTAVARRAGLSGVRLHDLRHTFASYGAGSGLGLPIIGKLLGHSQAATTQRYAHLDTDPLRRASNHIGERISIAMGEACELTTISPSAQPLYPVQGPVDAQ